MVGFVFSSSWYIQVYVLFLLMSSSLLLSHHDCCNHSVNQFCVYMCKTTNVLDSEIHCDRLLCDCCERKITVMNQKQKPSNYQSK